MSSALTVTDFFCGMGGSSTGLVASGFEVKLAANHWARAIETHSANHPDTEHLCADLTGVDLRYLPRTDALWASPICTEVSPAGGRRKRGPQLDLFEDHGHVPTEAFERTRATFWEVIRATEVHRYAAVMVENVVEAAQWELFDVWLTGMETLGYRPQFVSVSAAHVGDATNPHAPQWRDRLYIVFTRKGVPLPDVDPRPTAWCDKCGTDVPAQQWWKRDGRRIGKYGTQYIYVCPVGNHGRVEPYIMPAAAAIDWSDLGTRIGDRPRPLSAATMRRIQAGLDKYAQFIIATNHDSGRHFDPHAQPLPTRSTKNGEGLVVAAAGNTYDTASGKPGNYLRAWPTSDALQVQTGTQQHALVTMLRRNGTSEPTDRPLPTFAAGGFHHGLTVPPGAFVSQHHGGYADPVRMNSATTDPLPTMTAQGSRSLVVPFRRGSSPYRADEGPLSTLATREAHAVLTPDEPPRIEDFHFRMLQPREAASAQRFPLEYVIHGNKGEQQMQAGNAVAVNVAQWIGAQVAEALA